jgi:hypothetical protein
MFKAKIEYTKYHYSEFYWSHFIRRESIIPLMGFALILFIFNTIYSDNPEALEFSLIFGFVLYVILIAIFFTLIIKVRVKKSLKDSAKDILFEFNEQQFHQTSLYKDQPIDQTGPYVVFKKVVVTKRLILLYIRFNMAIIIPKTSLVEGNVNDFIRFLKERIHKAKNK